MIGGIIYTGTHGSQRSLRGEIQRKDAIAPKKEKAAC